MEPPTGEEGPVSGLVQFTSRSKMVTTAMKMRRKNGEKDGGKMELNMSVMSWRGSEEEN